jgi:hypothetical protein
MIVCFSALIFAGKKDSPMRLGQLARKLSISPAEVSALLAERNIQTEEGANTRLTDEQLTWILQYYGKEMATIALSEDVASAEDVIVGAVASEPVMLTEQAVDQAVISNSMDVQQDADITVQTSASMDELPALIKAPKIELSGLKILGKIELPEPRKKEVSSPPESEAEVVKPESSAPRDRRQQTRGERGNDRKQGRNRESDRPRKNPVALQREREAREAEEKQQERARQEKERRTQYYQQRVKASVPTKPARLFDEPTTDMKNERKSAPTGWFGKLIRWFKS